MSKITFGEDNRKLDFGGDSDEKEEKQEEKEIQVVEKKKLLDLTPEYSHYYDEMCKYLFENHSRYTYYPNTKMGFGKYKTQQVTLEYVINNDIDYFWWCIAHSCFKLSKKIIWPMIDVKSYLKHSQEIKYEQDIKELILLLQAMKG